MQSIFCSLLLYFLSKAVTNIKANIPSRSAMHDHKKIIPELLGSSGFLFYLCSQDCETRLRLSRSALPLATEGTQESEHAPLPSACTSLAVDSAGLRKLALGQDVVELPCGHCHTEFPQLRKDKQQINNKKG